MSPWFPKVSEPHEHRPSHLSLAGRLDVKLRNFHDGLLAGKNIPAWKGQENSFSPWVVTGHFGDFLFDEQQCHRCLSKMTEHISAPVLAPPQLQEGQDTSGLKEMTTVAQAWAETGTPPLTPSHHISSQICCTWDPTNTQEMVPNTLICLRCTLGPAHPPVQTHLLVAGKWQGRRHFSWHKREPLLPQKCQEAFRCWWCGHKTCPLVLLVSYFFAIRSPILLPSSSFPQQCFRLRPKHTVRVTRNQPWSYLP